MVICHLCNYIVFYYTNVPFSEPDSWPSLYNILVQSIKLCWCALNSLDKMTLVISSNWRLSHGMSIAYSNQTYVSIPSTIVGTHKIPKSTTLLGWVALHHIARLLSHVTWFTISMKKILYLPSMFSWAKPNSKKPSRVFIIYLQSSSMICIFS